MVKNIYTVILLCCFSSFSNAQIFGCNDFLAKNYNSSATSNDGSCIYKSTAIKPIFSVVLENQIHETSGLIKWNNFLWTHNDDTDVHLYALDTLSGKIIKNIELKNVKNTDWEELAQDSLYLYVGDFGNNYKGNRTNLHILRIEKASLFLNEPKIDTINFHYSNQFDFEQKKPNKSNFDCEAMVVTPDNLYLFTKQWKSKETSIYSLPKSPGNFVAQFQKSITVKGLITGAIYFKEKEIVVLCGYSKKLKPFIYLLYDYKDHDFFSGNKRKIKLKIPFHQIEGITTSDGLHYYLTNENFTRNRIISNPQKLHFYDLSFFIKPYLDVLKEDRLSKKIAY